MLVQDVADRVRRQFGDESSVQVTDTDIIRWVNDAQREIIAQTEDLLQTSVTTNTVANQQDYDVPPDMFVLRSLHYKPVSVSSFIRLKSLSMEQFDEYIDGWEGSLYAASDPIVYHIYAGKIRLFPIPATAQTNVLKIYYSRKPVDVAALVDTVDLPDTYFNAVVSYCLAKSFEMDEDWGAAANMAGQMNSDVRRNQNRHNTPAWETYPTIGVRAEDM